MSSQGPTANYILEQIQNGNIHPTLENKEEIKNYLLEGSESEKDIAAAILVHLAVYEPHSAVDCLDVAADAAFNEQKSSIKAHCLGVIAGLAKEYPHKAAKYSDRVAELTAKSHGGIIANSVETLAFTTRVAPQAALEVSEVLEGLLDSNDREIKKYTHLTFYNISLNYPDKLTPHTKKLIDSYIKMVDSQFENAKARSIGEETRIIASGTIYNICKTNEVSITDELSRLLTFCNRENDKRVKVNLTGTFSQVAEENSKILANNIDEIQKILYEIASPEDKIDHKLLLNVTELLIPIVNHSPDLIKRTNMETKLRELYDRSESDKVRNNISLIIQKSNIKESREKPDYDIPGRAKKLAEDTVKTVIIEGMDVVNDVTNDSTEVEIKGGSKVGELNDSTSDRHN